LEDRRLLSSAAGDLDGHDLYALGVRDVGSPGATGAGQQLPANVESNLATLYQAAMSPAVAPALAPHASAGIGSQPLQTLAHFLELDPTGRPLVNVWTVGPTALVTAQLRALDAKILNTSESYQLVEAWLDVADLPRIAQLEGVLSLTPVFRPITRTGSVTSQGDSLLHARDVRDPGQFPPSGYDGSGITVGILSDSINRVGGGLAASVATGDLPGPGNPLGNTTPVEVLQDFRGDPMYFDSSDEGRAMAEIIHDLAPGAKLAFHTAFDGQLDFAQGIRELARAGAKVIVDDVAYFDEPFFQDGIIAQAIEEVTSQYGVTYITAAGNDHGSFYAGMFRDDGAAASGSWHNFDASGGVDLRLRLTVPAGAYLGGQVILQWSDPWYTRDGVTNDFDLYAYNVSDGSLAGSATTRNLQTQQPTETMIWGGSPHAVTTYDIGIKRVAGSGPVEFKLWAVGGAMQEYNDGPAIVGHAMAQGAISVGAVPFYDPDQIESFSSHGPATVYFDAQGNRLPIPEIRGKPDLVATDNVNTSFFGTDILQDADTKPNFSGTSAAAPHVAAVAALLLSAQPALSPAQVRAALQTEADDLGTPGWDGTYGSGRVNAAAAATEVLTNPIYQDTTGPTVALKSPGATTARPIRFASLQFAEPLNAATANQAANYGLRSSGADGIFGNGDDTVYTVTPAYDADTHQTRLTWTTPAAVLPVGLYQLTVGTGLLDLAGNPLHDGVPQAFSFERTLWGEPFRVVPPPGSPGGGYTDVAVAPTGESMVVWCGDADGLDAVYAAIYDANGALVSAPFVPFADVYGMGTTVTYDPTGHFIVAFVDRWEAQSSDVYLGKYDLDGHEEWFQKFRDGWNFDGSPTVTVDGQGNVYAAVRDAVWPGEDHLWLRKFAPDGQPLTDPIRADDASVVDNKQSTRLAADSQGNLVLSWLQDADQVYARLFDNQCVAQGNALLIDDPLFPEVDSTPVVARNDQGFVVAWTTRTLGGGRFAYSRFYDSLGSAQTGRVLFNTPGLYATSYDPRVAFDSQGNLVATFVGDGHLLLRRFDASGSALGTEFQVPWDDSGAAGAVGVDGAGNVLVAWGGSGSPYARWLVNPLPTAPDLRIEKASVPARLTPGVTEQISATVWNFGLAPVSQSVVRYTLSDDNVVGNADDRPLVPGETYRSWPYGGYRQDVSADFVLPVDLASGTYHVFVEVDPYDRVTEFDESNNVAAFTVEVTVPPAALGELRTVNTSTTDDQTKPTMAMASDGRYVVVWAGNGPGDDQGIFAQCYDPWGNRQGTEFRVNTTAVDVQQHPAVAINASGNFVVVWESRNQNGSGWGVFGQRFAWPGTPAGDEFPLSDVTANDQTAPAVAIDGAGNFVAAWLDSAASGYAYYRRFTADGAPQESAQRFERDSSAVDSEQSPALAMAPDGRWVAVWASAPLAWEVRVQRFSADGTRYGDQSTVNSASFASVAGPRVAMDSAGRFLVVWTYGSVEIAGRFFAWDGANPTDCFGVNTYLPGSQATPAVAIAADGQALIAWVSPAQNGQRLVGQRFDSDGQPVGGEFYLSSQTGGSLPVAVLSNGWHIATAWQQSGDEGTTAGIFGRLFGVPPADLAELRAVAVTGPPVSYPGGPLPVSGTVQNVGEVAAPVFFVQYALFANLHADPLYLLEPAVQVDGGLAASGTWSDSRTLTVPATGIPTGTYYVGLLADSSGVVAEHVKLDNRVISASPVTIVSAASPDLQVTAVDVTESSVARGREITVTWTVTNGGLGATPSTTWYDQVVISADSVLGNADDAVADGPTFGRTGSLAKDASYTQTTTVSIPFSFADRIYVFVKTDVGGAVSEPACENNNFAGDATPLAVTEVTAPLPTLEGFEGGSLANLPSWWAFDTQSNARIRFDSIYGPHSGSTQLLIDSSPSGGSMSRIFLTFDASQGRTVLRYWHKKFGIAGPATLPEYFTGVVGGGGVAISADGILWYRLENLDNISTTYQQHTIDLEAARTRLNLRDHDRFYILLQAGSDRQAPDNATAFDDFSLSVDPGDIWGARAVSSAPSGAVSGPVSEVQVTFSEPIDPASFTTADVTLFDPAGATFPAVGITTSDNLTFTVTFAPQTVAGIYYVRVGPQVLDLAGNAMNQDQNSINGGVDDYYQGSFNITAVPCLLPMIEGFEGGSFTALPACWSFSRTTSVFSVSNGSPHSGQYVLQMTEGNSRWDMNSDGQAAILHVDLLDGATPATGVTLDFWVKETSGGGGGEDGGVYIKVTGSTWTKLVGIAGSSTYQHYAFDLDALHLTYTDDVQILFQRGNYLSGGFAWDDIRVAQNIDVLGPRIVSLTPASPVAPPLATLQVTFNEDIDPMTFTAADVAVTDPGGGSAIVASVTDTGDHRTFAISLAEPQWLAGRYTIAIGPNVSDTAGNVMNQNNDALQGDGYSGTIDLGPAPAVTPPYAAGFEAGAASLQGWSASRTSGTVMIAAPNAEAGGYALQLYDAATHYTNSYYQEAILHVDLLDGTTPATDVVLDFWLKEYSGGGRSDDFSIWISPNGTNWTAVPGGTFAGSSTYQHVALPLDALIAYSDDVQIAFHHNSYYAGGFALDDVRVKTNALPINQPPTLSTISTLTGAAWNWPFTVSYATLASAADENDPDGGPLPLAFRIESVSAGTLTKDGVPVQAGVTLLGTDENLVWTPAPNTGGVLNAFTVRAWDGDLASWPAVQVQVDVPYGYTAAAYPRELVDLAINGPGVVKLVDNTDDWANPVPLGTNSFTIFGTRYTGSNTLYASDNGCITFANPGGPPTNSDLTSTPSLRTIAVLWDDWTTVRTSQDAVLYKFEDLSGDGTPDRLILEWNQVPNDGAAISNPATFQAILQLNTGSTDGVILLNYRDVDVGDGNYNNGASATVGIKDAGTQGPNRLLVSYNSGTNPLIGSEKAIRITSLPDATPPMASLVAVSPDPRNAVVDTMTITFSEPVTGLDLADLTLTRDGGENLLTGAQTLITTDAVTWTLGNLSPLTQADGLYELQLNSANAWVKDNAWNVLATDAATSWIMDTLPPAPSNLSPPDDAVGVPADTSLAITFGEPIRKGTGSIILKQASDASVVETIDVAGAGVTVDGVTVTIVLANLLAGSTDFYVEVAAGAFQDLAGNDFAGITGSADWNFDTNLIVTSLTPTSTGFRASFNQDLEPSVLNLYDQGGVFGAADVIFTGKNSGTVRGSLVLDPDLRSATFIKTEGLLQPDDYSVTLTSAATAFRDAGGNLLDGDQDGTPGGDFVTAFTILEPAANAVTVSLPNVTRGYGQPLNVPASELTAGLPLSISNGQGVTEVSLEVHYDPALLTISAFILDPAVESRAAYVLNTSTSGVAVLSITAATGLADVAGPLVVGSFTAVVPDDAPYAGKHVLDIADLQVYSGEAEVPSRDDDAIHIAAFLGDANGDGWYNSPDATLTRRIIGVINTGLAAYQLADPGLIVDIDGNGYIQANDTTSIRRAIGLIAVPNIPPLPTGLTMPTATGPDPRIYIPRDLGGAPGQTFSLPVMIEVTEPSGVTIGGFDLFLEFDANKFTVSQAKIGDLLQGTDLMGSLTQPAPGRLIFSADSMVGTSLLPFGTVGNLVTFTVAIASDAVVGPAAINLLNTLGIGRTGVFGTDLRELVLNPPPTNAANDTVDGIVTIDDGQTPWHNAVDALDVNGDGRVTPLDAMIVINRLNAEAAGGVPFPSGYYYDVNNDRVCTAQDVLLVINYLNAQTAAASGLEPGAAEGERPSGNARDGLFDDLELELSPLESVLDDLADDIAAADSAENPQRPSPAAGG
jgi:hypothetical protein